MHHPFLRGLVPAVFLVACLGAQPAAAASSTTFSGRATVVSGTVAGQPVSIVDTGPLPSGGGAAHNCLLAYPTNADCQLQTVPDQTNGAVALELLSARTVGQGSHSQASSSTVSANVDLGRLVGIAGLPTLAASVLTADANAACQAGVAAAGGAAQVLDATLGGLPVDLSLGTITVPTPLGPVTIRFDQVDQSSTGSSAQANAKALEIVAPFANTDLVIGFAHADITCGSASPQAGCSDKVTGGGWYDLGSRDHFALAASAGDPTWGHLLYDDKAAGLKFHGTPDFAVLVPGPTTSIPATSRSSALPVSAAQGAAVVSGTNAQPFTLGGVSYPAGSARFVAVAVDNGEGGNAPGDVFGIVLFAADGSTLYASNATGSAGVLGSLLGTRLGGGNVQYHGCR